MFLAGLAAGLILGAAPLIVGALRAGPVRTVTKYGEHPVSDERAHEHSYAAWLPWWFVRLHTDLVAPSCVYTRLGKTPAQVWDDEVRRVILRDQNTAESDTVRWVTAEQTLRAEYGIGQSVDELFAPGRGRNPIDRIAASQLARLRQPKPNLTVRSGRR